MEKECTLEVIPTDPDPFRYVFVRYSEVMVFDHVTIYPAVDLSTGELLIASKIALNDTL